MKMLNKSAPAGQGPRKRRAHTKSKRGCRNCKLRRVKCDETRPQCQNCVEYRVACNYIQGPDLQVAWPAPGKAQSNEGSQIVFKATPIPRTILPVIVVGEGHGSFHLNLESQARLYRFYHRTLPTIGTPRMTEVYQKETTGLALAHPFLMHIILTIATTHDRHLLAPTPVLAAQQSLPPKQESHLIQTESQHRAQAASLLNTKLSKPIIPHDRDALWAAAAMLGISVLTSTETPVQESWPLKPSPANDDLQWMDFSINKKAIWNITNPLRPDSAFHTLADTYRELIVQPRLCSVDEIAREFVELCGFDESTSFPTTTTSVVDACPNPYFKAVSMLTRSRGEDFGVGGASRLEALCAFGVMPRDLAFVGFMEMGFKALLGKRDVRALLILAYWYAPLCRGVWWIARRAWIECRAICLYLERRCAGDELVGRLLGVVRVRCGLGELMGV